MVIPRPEDLTDSFFGFARPVGVAVDGSGRVYVADAGPSRIHVFGTDGAYERSLGGPGAGPRELGSIAGIGVRADTLVVLDRGNGRIAWLSSSGEPFGHAPWPPIGGAPRDIRVYPAACGYYTRTTVASGSGLRRAYELWCGADRDTIYPPAITNPGTRCIEAGGGMGFRSNPFAPRELETPAYEGGIATARVSGTTLQVRILDREGETVRLMSDSVPRFAIPREIRDSVSAAHQEFLRSWTGADCTQVGAAGEDRWPALQQMYYSYDGDLVLALFHPVGTEMRVFRDPDRPSSIHVRGDPHEAASFARDRRLYLFRADSMDVPRLEVYPY